MAPRGNVVEILAADPKFSTLVAAVKAAGLVDTLSSGLYLLCFTDDFAWRNEAKNSRIFIRNVTVFVFCFTVVVFLPQTDPSQSLLLRMTPLLSYLKARWAVS